MTTTKAKFPAAEALAVANELADKLRPLCSRLEIVGSLRRGKQLVSDAEILYVPILRSIPDPGDLFGPDMRVNEADVVIGALEGQGIIARRPKRDGTFTFGSKNKLMIHVSSGIPIDFFGTTEANFWVSLVIRTGGVDTNLRLTTGALARGRSLNAYGCGVTDLQTKTVTPAYSEEDVFKLCGIGYLPPQERS